MKSLIHRSATPLGAIFAALFLLIIVVAFMIVSRVSATNGQQHSGRVVTIHDRGTEKLILTNALTVGDALKEAGVELDAKDAVEPVVAEKLVSNEYSVNIYRARAVIIVDGTTMNKVITPYQTAEQIARSAGVTLYPEDTTTLVSTNDIISDGAGLKLTIVRATPFNFTLYGKTTESRTQAKSVGEMLAEKGIALGSEDRVIPAASTPLSAGLSVRVWREGKQTITVDESINFGIEQIQDGDQYVGYRATKTPGVAGARSVTYEVTVQDGNEVGRTEIASITTKNPANQIDIVGAKYRGAYTTPSENEVISWNFLLANGFSREQTAGIMGNLMQEHRFNTTGDGLAQWTGARKAALLSRPDPYNIYTQLQFLMEELNGGYSRVRDEIRTTNSVTVAVQIFQNKFEKCGICAESNRIQYAFNILASH
ncbi:hypothetical protein BH10PAT4_BH10PAT4_2910 [soil metagenome]